MANYINIGSAGFSKAERGPIDKNIVFDSVEEMRAFVSNAEGTAYAGQIISISDNKKELYKVINPGGNFYTTIPLINSGEFFNIEISNDGLAGLGNKFSSDDPQEQFDYGLASYAYYSELSNIHRPLCEYFGFTYKNPNSQTEQINYSPLIYTKALRFILPDDGATVIPNIYHTDYTQAGRTIKRWYIEYIYKRNQSDAPPEGSNWFNMLYRICIVDDPNDNTYTYPLYVYKLDLNHPQDDLVLTVNDLD